MQRLIAELANEAMDARRSWTTSEGEVWEVEASSTLFGKVSESPLTSSVVETMTTTAPLDDLGKNASDLVRLEPVIEEVVAAETTISSTNDRSHEEESKVTHFQMFCDIHFDGGSRGNPGVAGCGSVLKSTLVLQDDEGLRAPDERTLNIRQYLGDGLTNNQAEYHGVIGGLEEASRFIQECRSRYGLDGDHCDVNLKIQGDSKLVLNQLRRDYKCRSKKLLPLYECAHHLLSDLEDTTELEVAFKHIPRKLNHIADGRSLYRVSEVRL